MIFKKCVMAFAFLVLVSAFASAGMNKGSVGNKGTKSYTYIPNEEGHSQFALIYDAHSADLDMGVGFSSNGQSYLVGTGISTVSNYEFVECGVSSSIVYTVVVSSYSGGSPFHVSASTAGEESLANGVARVGGGLLIENKEMTETALQILDQMNRIKEASLRKK